MVKGYNEHAHKMKGFNLRKENCESDGLDLKHEKSVKIRIESFGIKVVHKEISLSFGSRTEWFVHHRKAVQRPRYEIDSRQGTYKLQNVTRGRWKRRRRTRSAWWALYVADCTVDKLRQTPLWLTPNIRRVKVCFSCFLNLTLLSLLWFFVPCSLYRGPGTRFFLNGECCV